MSAPTPVPSSRFARLASFSYRHKWRVFAAWIVALIAINVIGAGVGTKKFSDFRLPGTESQRAYDLLKAHSPQQNGTTDQLAFRARTGTITDAANKQRIESALAQVRKVKGVADVSSPFSGQISKDKKVGVAQLEYTKTVDDLKTSDLKKAEKDAFKARGPTLQVEHGGQGAETVRFASQGGPSEGVGILAAALVLIITLGAFLAAGSTLLSALISLGTTIGLITLASHLVDTPDFASQLAALIGLGVGVDYSLFVFTRFRAETRAGRPREEAMVRAMDTAGRTVFFAACTVIIALLGLLLLGLNFLQGVAIGAALAVLLTMFAALTLLPAFVSLCGERIDGFKWSRRMREKRRPGKEKGGDGHRWRAWAGMVQKRPVPFAIVSLIVLLALAAPVTQLRLGSGDASTDPPASTTHKAYELIADNFGAGINGSFLVVVDTSKGSADAPQKVAATLKADRGILAVSPARKSPDGKVATLTAFPRTGAQQQATSDTLKRVRKALNPVEDQTGVKTAIGGQTAGTVDFTSAVARKLPLFVGVVVLLSALLLLFVFRSILIPIKAAIMNLLSIGASLGVITLIFQEGHGAGVLGIGTGPIESFFPVLLFAIVFGLSMDYEVFLISRVHESWEETKNPATAVGDGLATTGRVITAAGAIMVLVFLSFVLGDDRVIKLFGIGLASAIFLDAVIIRCVLVPAVMQLFGSRAWWLPGSLDRVLPRIALESGDPKPRSGQPATSST